MLGPGEACGGGGRPCARANLPRPRMRCTHTAASATAAAGPGSCLGSLGSSTGASGRPRCTAAARPCTWCVGGESVGPVRQHGQRQGRSRPCRGPTQDRMRWWSPASPRWLRSAQRNLWSTARVHAQRLSCRALRPAHSPWSLRAATTTALPSALMACVPLNSCCSCRVLRLVGRPMVRVCVWPAQCNHRSWADFFADIYITEGRAALMGR